MAIDIRRISAKGALREITRDKYELEHRNCEVKPSFSKKRKENVLKMESTELEERLIM